MLVPCRGLLEDCPSEELLSEKQCARFIIMALKLKCSSTSANKRRVARRCEDNSRRVQPRDRRCFRMVILYVKPFSVKIN